MLFLLEGQLQNSLTFSPQIDVKSSVREMLTFPMKVVAVTYLKRTENKCANAFRGNIIGA